MLLIRNVCTENGNFHKNHSIPSIKVALSERKPFAIVDQNGKPNGLDVQIIENFAKKLNLRLEYFFVNLSLNYVFANENNVKALDIETLLGYVLSSHCITQLV